jgi:hypothetical protein
MPQVTMPDGAVVEMPDQIDPALGARLRALQQSQAQAAPGMTEMNSVVPSADAPTAPVAQTPEPSIWEKFKSMSGDVLSGKPLIEFAQGVADDPVLSMWGHGLKTIAQGAPEVALDLVNNAGVQSVAGLTGSFVPDANDSAGFMRDFTENNSLSAGGESAKQLEAGLGEAFEPFTNIKNALGEGAEAAGAGPLAATGASMLPDLGAALLGGGPAASTVERGAAALAPKVEPTINPAVEGLRAADIRMRPSDVRAVTPNKKIKVPGETRERFADGPDLKKDMTLHNQTQLTDLNAKDIGVKSLDDAAFDTAREAPAKKYETVENVLASKPELITDDFRKTFQEAAASARLPKGENYGVTRVIGALRRRAAKRIQNDQVATEEAGFADRELAERLEEQMGKALEAAGEPQLLGEYQEARQQFAKIHDVETATRAGQIDAHVAYKLKKRGVPLTGALKLTADAAEYAPNVTKHSTTTAAREGAEVPTTLTGAATDFTKRLIRKIPGMDVGAPRVQNKFGVPDEARASYYGQDNSVAPPRGPEQGGLDLREALDLEPPPGAVGAPARTARELGPQVDALGSQFEFDMPPGEVGIPPEAPMSLQDLLGLGEPLDLKKSPGRVGKPKRKT